MENKGTLGLLIKRLKYRFQKQRKGDTAIKQKRGWAEVQFLKGTEWKLQGLYPDGLNSQKKLEKTQGQHF